MKCFCLFSFETKYLKWIHMISALNTIIEIDLSVIVTFVSVIVLVLFTDLKLNPAYIVYAAAFYTRLNGTLGYFLSKAIKNGASTLVSVQRVKVSLDLCAYTLRRFIQYLFK